jgi:hypothetical protein
MKQEQSTKKIDADLVHLIRMSTEILRDSGDHDAIQEIFNLVAEKMSEKHHNEDLVHAVREFLGQKDPVDLSNERF